MQKERLQKLNGWARQNLTQYILPFWTSDFIIDHEYGGFYGRVSAAMEIDNTEPRADIGRAHDVCVFCRIPRFGR